MRILIAGQSNYISHNGQSVFTKNLAEGLVKYGNEVMLLLPSERKKAYHETINGVEIQTMTSVNPRFIHPEIFLPLFPPPTVDRIFRTFQPEIVHIHDHYPVSWFVYLAARKYKVRIIGTNHFMPENLAPHVKFIMFSKPLFNRVMWLWMLSLYNHLDFVTAPSQTALSILRKEGLISNATPISCGVDLDHFKPTKNINKADVKRQFGLNENKKTFLFVGRIDGEKRLDVLLQAMKILNRDDIQLGIAGIGTELENLKKLAHKLQVEDNVRFLGFIPDESLPILLTCVDIFAMPSQAELLSIATLEAMGCEKPLLAASAGALPELVSSGENGFLFESGNPSSAAKYMAMLADCPEKWSMMGKMSRQKAMPHNIPNIIQLYEKAYDSAKHRKPFQHHTQQTKPKTKLEKVG